MSPLEQFRVTPLIPLHLAGYDISFTNQALMMCIVLGLTTLFLLLTVKKNRLVPTRGQSMAELAYEFVAGMIESTAGKGGYKFFPFVFAVFMFVLMSNYFGLIPGVFTVTSQIAVNFALASLVVAVVIVSGFLFHGVSFLTLFVPEAPWVLLPLLVPIEVISFFFRPISLSVRLFANMLAGHTMLKVFAAFVIILGGAGGVLSAIAVAPMFMIVAIMALEFLVAFLQAYVFAMLTCIYLNEALHLHGHH
ncbi:MAG: F0F1 ATP synthase subunit A [Alphaproteobacteria bacterium]|nr:F0F1 ATP synthase subunit A [Alphaproteobacteria bacterium]MBU6471369.1 F0F1 ATP synthase subunit A [Alphaproteobacteria bacterium]MDE2012589.1 F0F1 ATP synthase subunit A [Alphaproteobacteria bacterium]MDE2073454.1 F0F1 ATP synthase subunit A [Alphaproteobacteria bacterium]MDE2350930.1 F0F1 ATP synthase subunit A [Alphaproteobacteria bacterium]